MSESHFLDLNPGDLVRFLRLDSQGGAGVSLGDIGIVIDVSFYSYQILLGDPAYENYRYVPLNAAADWLSLEARPNRNGESARVWWSKHWHEYQPETNVIFRVDREGVVFALFPDLPATDHPNFCSCYQSIGGHAAADLLGCVRSTRPATRSEYDFLKTELESAPYFYRLKVCIRTPPGSWDRRRQALLAFHV